MTQEAPRLLAYEDLRPRGITLSKLQLWRLERLDRFPKRVRISDNRFGWVENEVDNFLRERIAARDAEVAA
jgi:predicted DNA-binding transcriptional regulator AlpA